jgi:hypothetical protein
MYLPISGWTWKSRKAPIKIVSANAGMPDYAQTNRSGNLKPPAWKVFASFTAKFSQGCLRF